MVVIGVVSVMRGGYLYLAPTASVALPHDWNARPSTLDGGQLLYPLDGAGGPVRTHYPRILDLSFQFRDPTL
jgi:hypothetical protein